eukprot:1339113-Amphidinium_carterae.1
MKVLQDIFANKATATLRLRHNSVMKFVNWKRSVSEDLADNTLPVDEQTLYDYVCFLRVAKAAKSTAKNFVESLSFMAGAFDGPMPPMSSRVKGAVQSR